MWSPWSECTPLSWSVTHQGLPTVPMSTRTRQVWVAPRYSGKACPALSEDLSCVFSLDPVVRHMFELRVPAASVRTTQVPSDDTPGLLSNRSRGNPTAWPKTARSLVVLYRTAQQRSFGRALSGAATDLRWAAIGDTGVSATFLVDVNCDVWPRDSSRLPQECRKRAALPVVCLFSSLHSEFSSAASQLRAHREQLSPGNWELGTVRQIRSMLEQWVLKMAMQQHQQQRDQQEPQEPPLQSPLLQQQQQLSQQPLQQPSSPLLATPPSPPLPLRAPQEGEGSGAPAVGPEGTVGLTQIFVVGFLGGGSILLAWAFTTGEQLEGEGRSRSGEPTVMTTMAQDQDAVHFLDTYRGTYGSQGDTTCC
jgi:hypothetical protein